MLKIDTERRAYLGRCIAPRAALFGAMWLASAGVTAPLWAQEPLRCPPPLGEDAAPKDATSADEEPPGSDQDLGGFRRLAAPFAPAVAVRVWYQSRAQTQQQARAYVITKPARPHQVLRVLHEPFGWQVSLSWNLVDIARSVLPGEETPLRLYASDCAAFARPADALFDYSAEDDQDARGDLQ